MRIAIAGGHATPALALIEYAIKMGDEVLYIGQAPVGKKKHFGREKELVEKYRNVLYREIQPVKWDRFNKLDILKHSPKFIQSVKDAKREMDQFQPDVVVGFGGYLSLPVGLAGKMMGKRLVIHEQTTRAGLANRMLSKIAKVVAISYESSKNLLPEKKVKLTGNLVREVFFRKNPKPDWIHTSDSFILVTGGSQGSELLNKVMIQSLNTILEDYSVVHQFGNQELEAPERMRLEEKYIPRPWLSAEETAYAMKQASLIISRAGANTVSEIMVSGTPAILVPLKNSQQDEQWHNAKLIEKAGAGEIIHQDELDDAVLLTSIHSLVSDPKYTQNAMENANSPNKDAVANFYSLLK